MEIELQKWKRRDVDFAIAPTIWIQEVLTFLAAPRKVSGSLVTKLTIALMGRLISITRSLKVQHSNTVMPLLNVHKLRFWSSCVGQPAFLSLSGLQLTVHSKGE